MLGPLIVRFLKLSTCAKGGILPKTWEVYLKKDGRKKFQFDLGRDLMSYAICNCWTNMDELKPNWMRRASILPCECNKCFFCLQSLTTGIDHKRKRHTVRTFVQRDGTRTKTDDCTDKQVNLGKGSAHCRQCNRERTGTRAQKMYKIPKPEMGCPSCDEVICKMCWDKECDMHQRKKP